MKKPYTRKIPDNCVEIPIAQLVREDRYQVRKQLDSGWVKRLVALIRVGVEDIPPVKVAKIGEAFALVDGYHRVEALETIGERSVMAEVVEVTEEEALVMASKANLKHGLQIKQAERRNSFKLFIEGGGYRIGNVGRKSFRDMAKELGIPSSTLWNWMKKDFPIIARLYRGEEDDPGERRETSPVDVFAKETEKHLDSALASFVGVTNPETRYRLIEHAAHIHRVMKAGEGWKKPDEGDDDPF